MWWLAFTLESLNPNDSAIGIKPVKITASSYMIL